MPRTDQRTKALLTDRLTEAFTASTEFSVESLGIRYLEYDLGEAANEGQLWDGHTGKPYLHLVLHSPRLRGAQKKKLITALTETFVECVRKPDWKPVIFIAEYPYDNVGVDGRPIAQGFEEYAGKEFYYQLPDD
jgi:phenylpyruvate tautomerase PptA (4-oxalocrotonate tautomerase family)